VQAVFTAVNKAFAYLPLAAIGGNCVFCVHGGIGPDLNAVEQIEELPTPREVPEKGLVRDLLWADPTTAVGYLGTESLAGGKRSVRTRRGNCLPDPQQAEGDYSQSRRRPDWVPLRFSRVRYCLLMSQLRWERKQGRGDGILGSWRGAPGCGEVVRRRPRRGAGERGSGARRDSEENGGKACSSHPLGATGAQGQMHRSGRPPRWKGSGDRRCLGAT
jgi:hypothetical protein